MRDQTRQAIYTALQTGWATSPPLEMVYSNDTRKTETKTPWARATVHIGDTAAAAIGSNHVRSAASLTVQVFLPEREGAKAAFQTADKLDEILRFVRIPVPSVPGWTVHLESQGGSSGPTPAGKRDGYDQMMIAMTFRLDAIRTP
jgi:hypothetical protein